MVAKRKSAKRVKPTAPVEEPRQRVFTTMSFTLDAQQLLALDKWRRQQRPVYTGAIGGRYTYSFHPTTLGTVVKVKDEVTGEEIDLSDYGNW